MPLLNLKDWTITLHPGENEKELRDALRFAGMGDKPHPWRIVKEAPQKTTEKRS